MEYLNAQRCPLASPVIPISPDLLFFHHHACTVPCCLGNPMASHPPTSPPPHPHLPLSLSRYTGTSVLAPEQLRKDSLRLCRGKRWDTCKAGRHSAPLKLKAAFFFPHIYIDKKKLHYVNCLKHETQRSGAVTDQFLWASGQKCAVSSGLWGVPHRKTNDALCHFENRLRSITIK